MTKNIILQANGDFGKSYSGLRNYHIYKELIKRGYNVKVLCRDNCSEFKDNIICPIPFRSLIPKFLTFMKRFGVKSADYSNKLFDKCSQKYINNVDLLITFVPLLESVNIAKERNIKVAVNVPSLSTRYNLELESECRKYNVDFETQFGTYEHNLLCNDCYNQSDYLLAQSDYSIHTFIECGFNKDKFYNVGNTVLNMPETNLYLTQKKDDTFRILFVGENMIRKGLQYLIPAFLELEIKDKELIIVGDFVSKSEKAYFSQYFGIPNIKFVGHKDPKEYYMYCDLFVFPSLSEGAARACYEAMSYGMPVLATIESGAPIDKAFIIKSDGSNILDKINLITQYPWCNNMLLEYIGSHNYKDILNCNIVNYCNKFCDIVDDILKDKK